MPDQTHPKAVTGVPVVVLRKTGYYVDHPDGGSYIDPGGHSWFGKSVARAIAYEIGGWYHEGGSGTLKQVVTGYLPPAPDTAPAPADNGLQPQLLLGCTCGGIGNTGSHDRSCVWSA